MRDWLSVYRAATDPRDLVERMMNRVVSQGGVVHIWGHSWEIDQRSMWNELEDILRILASQPGVRYVTNRELVRRVLSPPEMGSTRNPGDHSPDGPRGSETV